MSSLIKNAQKLKNPKYNEDCFDLQIPKCALNEWHESVASIKFFSQFNLFVVDVKCPSLVYKQWSS